MKYKILILSLLIGFSSLGASAKQNFSVTAVAFRVIPQEQTYYYQTPGSSYTTCYGRGDDFGMFLRVNVNCSTTYTLPATIPMTWRKVHVFNLIRSPKGQLIVGCTANWRFSKCSWLNPGDVFEAELDGNTLRVVAYKDLERKKKVKVKFKVLQVVRAD